MAKSRRAAERAQGARELRSHSAVSQADASLASSRSARRARGGLVDAASDTNVKHKQALGSAAGSAGSQRASRPSRAKARSRVGVAEYCIMTLEGPYAEKTTFAHFSTKW